MQLHLPKFLAAITLLSTLSATAPAQAQSTSQTTTGLYKLYVQTGGTYTISITGGSGAANYPAPTQYLGGTGASVTGSFTLNPCDELTVIVGRRGYTSNSNAGTGGGGGGGTAVILNGTQLLLAAGGGGGASYSVGGGGGLASATNQTPAGGASPSGAANGSGGGGFGAAGANATGTSCNQYGGYSYGGGAGSLTAISSGGAGTTNGCLNTGTDGNGGAGFGGGGGTTQTSGGGGGGYVGGATNLGGDSYVNPIATNVSRTAGTANAAPAAGTDGSFTINTTLTTSRNLQIATTSMTTNQSQLAGSTPYRNQCDLIATVTPAGAAPVSGSIDATVTIDPSIQTYNGAPYVQRHYDIVPANGPNTATATITLYFTQAEFSAFNAARGGNLPLPTASTDPGNNKANLRVNQFHGTPAGGNAPANYPYSWAGSGPARVVITPTSVTWNATALRWEVTFPVSGFSGFFVSTNVATPLAVALNGFRVVRAGDANRIEWRNANTDAGTNYELGRSKDGRSFSPIATVAGDNRGSYSVEDAAMYTGTVYYRLKATTGTAEAVSNIVSIKGEPVTATLHIAPQPAHNEIRITPGMPALIGSEAFIRDMQGRLMQRFVLSAEQRIDISQWPAGIYSLSLPNGEVVKLMKN